jgi:hypothetical protein
VLGRWAGAATVSCAVLIVALGIVAGPFLDALGASRLLPG